MHFNKILRSECNEKKGNRLKGDLNKNKERQMLRFFRFSCRIICIRYMFSCYACRILYFSLRFYTKKFCLDWKKSKKKTIFLVFFLFWRFFMVTIWMFSLNHCVSRIVELFFSNSLKINQWNSSHLFGHDDSRQNEMFHTNFLLLNAFVCVCFSHIKSSDIVVHEGNIRSFSTDIKSC